MSSGFNRVLEPLTNIAIIAAAVVVIVVTVRPYFQQSAPRPYKIGDILRQTPHVTFGRTTVLLFTRSTCPYCTQSMGLYRAMQANGARIIAATDEDLGINQAYLSANGVLPEIVVSAAGNGLDLRTTPTLLIVDAHGKVTGAWWGKQPDESATSILGRIK